MIRVQPYVYDACGVCHGNNASCAGCDGVPNSHIVYDACGVCGGTAITTVQCELPWPIWVWIVLGLLAFLVLVGVIWLCRCFGAFGVSKTRRKRSDSDDESDVYPVQFNPGDFNLEPDDNTALRPLLQPELVRTVRGSDKPRKHRIFLNDIAEDRDDRADEHVAEIPYAIARSAPRRHYDIASGTTQPGSFVLLPASYEPASVNRTFDLVSEQQNRHLQHEKSIILPTRNYDLAPEYESAHPIELDLPIMTPRDRQFDLENSMPVHRSERVVVLPQGTPLREFDVVSKSTYPERDSAQQRPVVSSFKANFDLTPSEAVPISSDTPVVIRPTFDLAPLATSTAVKLQIPQPELPARLRAFDLESAMLEPIEPVSTEQHVNSARTFRFDLPSSEIHVAPALSAAPKSVKAFDLSTSLDDDVGGVVSEHSQPQRVFDISAGSAPKRRTSLVPPATPASTTPLRAFDIDRASTTASSAGVDAHRSFDLGSKPETDAFSLLSTSKPSLQKAGRRRSFNLDTDSE